MRPIYHVCGCLFGCIDPLVIYHVIAAWIVSWEQNVGVGLAALPRQVGLRGCDTAEYRLKECLVFLRKGAGGLFLIWEKITGNGVGKRLLLPFKIPQLSFFFKKKRDSTSQQGIKFSQQGKTTQTRSQRQQVR